MYEHVNTSKYSQKHRYKVSRIEKCEEKTIVFLLSTYNVSAELNYFLFDLRVRCTHLEV